MLSLVYIYRLCLGLLFGGMTLYSFGFAPNLFKQMDIEKARPIIRNTFPRYYVFVAVLSSILCVLSYPLMIEGVFIFSCICLSTLYARQVLMPLINRASDQSDKKAFGRLHGFSVIIQVIQIIACGYVVAIY